MEKKYIEHEKVIEVIKNFAKGAISDGQKALDPVDDIVMLCRAVDMIPAADVAEVRRGEWRVLKSPIDAEVICSECGFSYILADPDMENDYICCPICMARMDGKEPSNGRR